MPNGVGLFVYPASMSISVMSKVWSSSKASHGSLLVLLAIADFANDEGEAYPSIATLQRKARLSERAAQNAIKELQEIGELSIRAGQGRNGTNLYRVHILPPAEIAPPQKVPNTPAEIAPKPSRNVIEDNGNGEKPSKASRLPTSEPAIRIAKLFGRKLTTEWSPKEIKAFKLLKPELDDLALIEVYYEFERKKGGDGWHRRDLQTFLNNYLGELDRARAWRENPKANEKTSPKAPKQSAHDRTAADRERDRTGLEPAKIPTRML
jgi:hypothetical protein